MNVTRDQLEFALSQYLDGTLMPLEAAALEERLATDAEARALLDEYRRLDAALRDAPPLPSLRWDRFADHLSDLVAHEQPPIRTYSPAMWRRAATVALAACVALVVGVAFTAYLAPTNSRTAVAPTSIVIGPQVEKAGTATVISLISVGPAPTMNDTWRYAESVISRPAVVMIDRASRSGQDGDSLWY
jgi:anti-sigma factor RsiW